MGLIWDIFRISNFFWKLRGAILIEHGTILGSLRYLLWRLVKNDLVFHVCMLIFVVCVCTLCYTLQDIGVKCFTSMVVLLLFITIIYHYVFNRHYKVSNRQSCDNNSYCSNSLYSKIKDKDKIYVRSKIYIHSKKSMYDIVLYWVSSEFFVKSLSKKYSKIKHTCWIYKTCTRFGYTNPISTLIKSYSFLGMLKWWICCQLWYFKLSILFFCDYTNYVLYHA